MSLFISKELENNIDVDSIFNEEDKSIYIVINDKKIDCEFLKITNKKNSLVVTLYSHLNFFESLFFESNFNFCFKGKNINNISSKNIKSIKKIKNKYKIIFVINKNKYLINNEVYK